MPGLDGTGPRGEGPMTGGGFGYCQGSGPRHYHPHGYWHSHPWGRHRWPWWRCHGPGRGYGWYEPDPYHGPFHHRRYPATPSDEMEMLKAEADELKSYLDELEKRIEELGKESAE